MTQNHGYNTPDQGTTEWHVPLNENFERLDSGVEIRDAESNLANYEPKNGAKFLATDTGTRYVGDGSAWTEVPVPKSIQRRIDDLEARIASLEEN